MPNYKRYYLPGSIVFLTIATYKRKRFLIENIETLRESIKSCPYNFKIIAGVVLPEHLHLLIKPEDMYELSKIVASIKYNFSKKLPKNPELSESKKIKGEKGIWQRRFYDHIIRDDNDLNKHIDYIHYNPIKHGYVNKAKSWKYSSFMKFVQKGFYEEDWCNFEDVRKIKNTDWE